MSKTDCAAELDCLNWFCRSYQTSEHWKQRARSIYLQTSGDSQASRRTLAAELIGDFELDTDEEAVSRWVKDDLGRDMISQVTVEKPKRKLNKFQWEFVAEYFLLCCRSLDDAMLKENSRRSERNRLRRDAYDSETRIQKMCSLIHSREVADSELLKAIRGATKREVSHARKQARNEGLNLGIPEPIMEDLIGPYELAFS